MVIRIIKKKGMPRLDEFVICKITDVNPNSVFVSIEEYGKEGMVHISEVSRGWIRDIRQHVKQGQLVVAKVIRISGDNISLSLKRVHDNQKNEKIKEYGLEKKAEKLVEKTAKLLGTDISDAYKEAGHPLQENFGSLNNGMKMILKNPAAVKKVLPEKWFTCLKDIVEKNVSHKELELKANLILRSYSPDGIHHIKAVLTEASKHFSVSYISAPKYLVKFKTMDAKHGEKVFMEKLKKIVVMDKDVDAQFEMIE